MSLPHNHGPFQHEALTRAKQYLIRQPWYQGVCMDSFPSEQECREDLEEAVNGIICLTELWDNPNLMNTPKHTSEGAALPHAD